MVKLLNFMSKIDVSEIFQRIERLREEGKLPKITQEDIDNEPTALAFTPYEKCECERPDDYTCKYCEERESARILKEAKIYSEIENAIMEWYRDADKTAGYLTRKILKIVRNVE